MIGFSDANERIEEDIMTYDVAFMLGMAVNIGFHVCLLLSEALLKVKNKLARCCCKQKPAQLP